MFAKIFKFNANPSDNSLFFFDKNNKTGIVKQPNQQNLRPILEDEEIAAAFDTRLDALIATPWKLEGGDEAANDFIYDEIHKHLYTIINNTWWALAFGKSVIQVVYNKSTPETRGITINSIFDEDASQFMLVQNQWTKNKKTFPEGKYFITTNKPSAFWPEGFPLLTRLVDVFDLRCNGWEFFMQYLEKFGVPFMKIKMGENISTADKAAIKKFLESPRPRGVALPFGSDAETVDGKTTSAGVFEQFDEMTRNQIFRIVLGQTLTSSAGTTGSLALGEVHERVSWNKTLSDSFMVSKTVQAIVKALFDLNKFKGDVPEFCFESPKGIQSDRADRDQTLNSIGVRFSKEYFVDQYDFDEEQIDYVPQATGGSSVPFSAHQFKSQQRFITDEKFQARIGEAQKLENKFIGEGVNYGKEIADIVRNAKSKEDIQAKLKSFIKKGTKDFDEPLTEAMLNSSISGAKDAK